MLGAADCGLAVLYLTYGVLYFLSLKGVEVLDWAAVLVGCLTVHFAGLTGHKLIGNKIGARPHLYPADQYTKVWWTYVFVDVAQFVAWGVAVAQLAAGGLELVPVGTVCLVVAYLGVIGCLGKLILYNKES